MDVSTWRRALLQVTLVLFLGWFGYRTVIDLMGNEVTGLQWLGPLAVAVIAGVGLLRMRYHRIPVLMVNGPVVVLLFVMQVLILLSELATPSASSITGGMLVLIVGWLAGAATTAFCLLLLYVVERMLLGPTRA